MGKFVRAKIEYNAMVEVDDTVGLFKLAEAVPGLKDKLLREIKRSGHEKLDNLTVDELTFEEVIMPDLPKSIKK